LKKRASKGGLEKNFDKEPRKSAVKQLTPRCVQKRKCGFLEEERRAAGWGVAIQHNIGGGEVDSSKGGFYSGRKKPKNVE